MYVVIGPDHKGEWGGDDSRAQALKEFVDMELHHSNHPTGEGSRKKQLSAEATTAAGQLAVEGPSQAAAPKS